MVGILNGYSHLVEYGAGKAAQESRDYLVIDHRMLKRTRNSRGILIGTARANPGKAIETYDDLKDDKKSARSDRLQRAEVAEGRCPDLDRRRRHPQDRQQARPVPARAASRRPPPDPGRPRPQDDRQRLRGDRLHLRLLHGRRHALQGDPEPPGRRRGDPRLLCRRDDGPKRRLAGLWRGHRRRGQPVISVEDVNERELARRRAGRQPQDGRDFHPQGHGPRQGHRPHHST